MVHVGAIGITTTGTIQRVLKILAFLRLMRTPTALTLTINAATTTGGLNGIMTFNGGTGALSITTSGTTTGTAAEGIYAIMTNAASTGDLTISAANTEGGTYGIYADNRGTGALSIITTGITTGKGTSNSSNGI